MIAYAIRRILLIIPTLFAIMVVNFVIVQAAPGGPVERPGMSDEARPIRCPDQFFDQLVDDLVLDSEEVAAAFFVGRLRTPVITLLVAGRQ